MTAMTNRNSAAATVGRPWLVPALAAVWLVALLLGGSAADQAVVDAIRLREGAGASVAVLITSLGNWAALLAATFFGVAWLIYRRQPRLALLLVAWTLAGRGFVALQKLLFAQVRPAADLRLVAEDSFAFPSGHAANSAIVYLLLALLLVAPGEGRRRALMAAVVLTTLIGISRVLIGVHWPSDVIGGWAFGLLWVLAGLKLAQTLNRNSSTSPS
jgi:membrane-associated phospholipid phosphatase